MVEEDHNLGLETLELEEGAVAEHHSQMLETQDDGERGWVLDGSLASGWAQVTSSVSGAESSGD